MAGCGERRLSAVLRDGLLQGMAFAWKEKAG